MPVGVWVLVFLCHELLWKVVAGGVQNCIWALTSLERVTQAHNPLYAFPNPKSCRNNTPFFCISFGGKICHEMKCDYLQSLFIQFTMNLHAFCCKNINNVFD